MKSRIIVLIISIIIAILVLVIGLFGLSSADNDTQKKTSSGEIENLTDDSNTEIGMTNESEETKNTEEENKEDTIAVDGNVNTTREIDPNKPMLALTFDDGPSRENT